MEILSDFLAWAWARHHNVLSWYIRPMFILPYIYFAYKRSWKGLVVTVIALATSMFWFPAPETVNPAVELFLQAEKDYISGAWGLGKVLLDINCACILLLPCTGILEAFLVVGCGGHQPGGAGQDRLERCRRRRVLAGRSLSLL